MHLALEKKAQFMFQNHLKHLFAFTCNLSDVTHSHSDFVQQYLGFMDEALSKSSNVNRYSNKNVTLKTTFIGHNALNTIC